MTKNTYLTIKEVVFEEIRKTQGNVIYQNLEEKVLDHFPDSAFKQTHWSWYRSQCTKGKYTHEFSDIEQENLRRFLQSNEESPEINVIEIDTNDLPSGVYYLKLTNTNKFFSTKKIVKTE